MSIMDIDQGLRAGNDFWLNGLRTNTIGHIGNTNDPTTLNCARIATKNVLFTFCNTVYRQTEYLKNPIEGAPRSQVSSKMAPPTNNSWVWILVGLDAATVIGIGIWIYFGLIRKRKPKETPEQPAA